MPIKLSAAQKKFMSALHEGRTASRNLDSVTGRALARKGLVKFVMFTGWILTPEGATIIMEEA